MAAVTLRVLVQLGVTLAAVLTAQYSLLNWLLGSHALPTEQVKLQLFGLVWMEGEKQQVELRLRIVTITAAFLLLYVHEAVAYVIPRRNLLRFRKEYLDIEREKWRAQLREDIRVNLMFVRRPWYLLKLVPIFEWTWNDGFSPHHRDANMWMCAWQGACGRAYRTRRPQLAMIPAGAYDSLAWPAKWLLKNSYHLTKRQMRKTSHLRAVLSIPIVRRTDALSPSYEAVGVLNLDTETEEGAQALQQDQDALAAYFMKIGKILAELRA